MDVHFESGWVFQNIPKTATTSIRRALGFGKTAHMHLVRLGDLNDCSGHMPAKFILEHVDQKILDLPWFTVCRNPYDRAVSEWHWRRDRGQGYSGDDFASWLRTVFDRGEVGDCKRHMLPQYDFVDGLNMQAVLRFEHLQEDWKRLFPNIELPRVHVAKKRRTTSLYFTQPDLVAIIRQQYAIDFEKFNYPTQVPA